MLLEAQDIKNKRRELGLNQKEFASALGLGSYGERTIRRWESGESKPSSLECAYISQLGINAPFQQNDIEQYGFTFCDLFAGIGGIRLPFQLRGGKCVFSCEWDKFAQKTYLMNFGEQPAGDIRQVKNEDIPDFDILLAGFPCQPFSLAGVSKKQSLGRPTGFEDETQGTLFFEVARIINAKKPKAFLLENVKNLVSHDHGRTFQVIMHTLRNELGYHIHWKILDSRQWTCQHRERIYIVGFRDDCEFNFDLGDSDYKRHSEVLADILEAKVDEKYTISNKLWQYLQDYKRKHEKAGNGFGYSLMRPTDTTRTLSARYHKDGSEILIQQLGLNPRKLTPRECARLQGFPEEFIIPVSDTQAYRQFGNSVTVPVIDFIAGKMIGALNVGLRVVK